MLLLLFVGTNNVWAYTDKNWDIVYHMDANADLDSTIFFPKGFLDGTVIDWFPNQPMGVWRTHYIEAIDGKNTNCFWSNINYDRKCFLRHGAVMSKMDIWWKGTTVYPTLNNVFEVSVDTKIQTGRFEFWLSWFGATYKVGLADGWEIWDWFLIDKRLKDNQWTAVQVFALDENGKEIKEGGLPRDFRIYMEWPNWEEIEVTEELWEFGGRKVVSSLNKQLNRGFCLNSNTNMYWNASSNPETTTKAYGSDCVPFNLIYGLTPKLYV